MAKPAPARLLRQTYPWALDLLPRFGDMDALRHLNNVALARLYEDARVRFQHDAAVHRTLPAKHGFLIAEVAIQYLAEGHYPDPLVAACGIGAIGRRSFGIAQALFQRDRCIGTADVTLVLVDRADSRPAALPEAARARLGQLCLVSAADAAASNPVEDHSPHA